MKIAISLIISTLLSINAISAQALKFSTPEWNFGTIAEEGGEVSHTFEFENNTSRALVITDIQTTCGCTTPQYSKQPIAAGAKSSIIITYDPMYRPGVFSRDVNIYTSANREAEVIKISGRVTPRKLSLEEQYPYILLDSVRISLLYTLLGNVSPKAPQQTQWQIINTSKSRRDVEFKVSKGSGLLSIDAPISLEGGESAVINATYAIPSGRQIYGELNDYIDCYVDGKRSGMQVRTRSYAVDDFELSAKKEGASGRFSEKIINFGALSLSSSDLSREFTIENLGLETLHIRAIESPKGIQVTSPDGLSVEPAERVTITVQLLSKELELGSMVKYITLILNDETSPVVKVKIVGEVSR